MEKVTLMEMLYIDCNSWIESFITGPRRAS